MIKSGIIAGMADAIHCPACNSVLNISSTCCDICLRPVSRQEIVRKLQAHKRHDVKKRRALYVAVALLVAAAAFAALPGFRDAVLKVAAPGVRVARAAKGYVAGSIKADWPDFTAPEEAKAPAPAAPPPPPKPAPTPEPAVPTPAVAPAPTLAPAPAAPFAATPSASPSWKISGLVYSLRDAKPMSGVEVAFSSTVDPTVKRARTDKAGRYMIALPVLEGGAGYRIELRSGKRALSYLEEAALPYRERTQAQREDAVEEARQSPVLHAALSPESLETTQDLAVLP